MRTGIDRWSNGRFRTKFLVKNKKYQILSSNLTSSESARGNQWGKRKEAFPRKAPTMAGHTDAGIIRQRVRALARFVNSNPKAESGIATNASPKSTTIVHAVSTPRQFSRT